MTAPSGAADSAISWTNALNILNSGNVGIGTTSPGYPLDVASDGEFKIRARNTNTGAGQNAYMTIDTASTAGESYLEFRTGQQGSTYGFIEYNRDGSLRFETSGHNDRMTIHSSGNVGIGTTSPGAKLDVAGAINSTGGIITPDIQFYGSQKIYNGDNSYLYIRSNSDAGGIRLMNNSNASVGYLYGYGSSFGFLTADGNWAVYMDQSSNWYSSRLYDKDNTSYYVDPASTSNLNEANFAGNVGIGTTSPGYKLQVVGGDVKIGQSVGDNRKLYFGDGSGVWLGEDADEGLQIYTNYRTAIMGGNVGIGTTSPWAKLHVWSSSSGEGLLSEVTYSTARAIYGKHNTASGIGYGVYAYSISTNGYGLWCQA